VCHHISTGLYISRTTTLKWRRSKGKKKKKKKKKKKEKENEKEEKEKMEKLLRYVFGPTLTRGATVSFLAVGAGESSLFSNCMCLNNGEGLDQLMHWF
jgi:hypothetical protein